MSTHEVQVSIDRVLVASVLDDSTIHAEVKDGRWPEAEQTVFTVAACDSPYVLANTLRDYGVDPPQELLDTLSREQRNARARLVASDPEARKRAEWIVARVSRHLGLEDAA